MSSSDATLAHERRSGDTTAETGPKAKIASVSEKRPDSDTLWVDWDGPQDPVNPKKWVIDLKLCPYEQSTDSF